MPLPVGALVAIDCEVEDLVERHCHAIVIGRVRDLQSSGRSSALANWHERYVAIDQDEDIALFCGDLRPGPAPEAEELTRTGIIAIGDLRVGHDLQVEMMKRAAVLVFYAIGTLAILYLALYAYVTLTGRQFTPGDPIHIFRNPDAPSYS